MALSRRMVILSAAVATLSGCVGVGTFRTFYSAPISANVSRNWHVVKVDVTVPRTLSVSEEHTYEPKADIVWREDAKGDRYAQVQAIMEDAIKKGASGLHGPRAVTLAVTMSRFHAMTFEAESISFDVGVHNIDFTAQVFDARTGEALTSPEFIDAAFPAMSGATMAQARAAGQSQRSQIKAHVASTIAGWLGTGPDPRMTFVRAGN
ncbi:MAG: DUF6778 family protein [Paracoccaceae bacterium]|jgi:hypothetical protein